MAYLEQSTRYVPYTDRPHGRWKYHVPAELDGSPLRETFIRTLDAAFETYARWIPPLEAHFRAKHPKSPQDSNFVYRSAIRAKALDTLRGLLPAATQSNVGIYATGQAYEALILRMCAHPLHEVREYAALMLVELRKVIPAFLTRVDQPDRGGRWSDYFRETKDPGGGERRLLSRVPDEHAEPPKSRSRISIPGARPRSWRPRCAPRPRSPTIDCSPPRDRCRRRRAVLAAYVGTRANRRHKPGRAFERTSYRFDILADTARSAICSGIAC